MFCTGRRYRKEQSSLHDNRLRAKVQILAEADDDTALRLHTDPQALRFRNSAGVAPKRNHIRNSGILSLESAMYSPINERSAPFKFRGRSQSRQNEPDHNANKNPLR